MRSPAFSPKAVTHRAEREAHIAQLQRSRWRVAIVDGVWKLAQHDGTGWRVWSASLQHHEDSDPVPERRRLVRWLDELLGEHTGFLHRDYAADADGRLAFDLQING